MSSSIKAWRELWIWGGALFVAAAACNPADDAKKPDPGDEDGGSGSEVDGTAGKTGEPGGDAAGGNDAVIGVAGAGGDPSAHGGAWSAAGDGPQAGGEGGGIGEGGSGGRGGLQPVEDLGRGQSGPLLLQVSVAQAPAVPGGHLLYTLTVGNTSNVAVKAVDLLFRVPKGLSFYYSSANPPSSTCGNSYCTENEEATWKLGDIPAGATRTIQLDPSVLSDVGAGNSIAPLIRLNATGLDPLTLNPSVPVVASTPAEVTLAADAEPVIAGDGVELVVDVGHIGDATLFAAELKLALPSGLEVKDISDGGSLANGEVIWPIDSLPVGGTLRRLVKVAVRSGNVAGDILNPRASLTYEGAEVDSMAQFPISVLAKASPLQLNVAPAADPVVPGGAALYNVTVSNTSLRAVDGIELILRVPAEASYYYSAAEPNSSTCGNSYCTGEELAAWEIGTLAAGTSQTITVNPEIVAAAAGEGSLVSSSFSLQAIGIAASHRFKTIAVQAKPAAQLVLGTTVSPVTPGQTFSYDLDVGQVGAGSLTQTGLVLELPSGLTVEAVSDGGTADGGIVSWTLGSVPVAGSVHRSVSVTVGDDVLPGAALAARATLTYKGGQERDAVSEHAIGVVAEALPLTVSLGATPSPIVLGGVVSYTTTIKNTSERTIDGVKLLLRVPEGHSYYYSTGADPDSSTCGNSYCTDFEEAVWDLGSIAAGATRIVNVNPTAATALVAGSLATFRQRLTAVDLGGTLLVQSTLMTKK